MQSVARALRIVWAAPASALGLALALIVAALGGRMRVHSGVIEAAWRRDRAACPRYAMRVPFRAITLGHVVLAFTGEEMEAFRTHERVHVRQYERWGPLFLPAYAASSVWQWMRGRDPYLDNVFEIEARGAAGEPR